MGKWFEATAVLLLLSAAFYAHMQLPLFTLGHGRVVLTRTVLVLTGLGFGLMAAGLVDGFGAQARAFLIGFGMVHSPAALVLLMKTGRGEGKS